MIVDPIYGSFEIEPVLEELLQSKPVQRLKGVHQGGASYLVNPKWNVTRYEHSVGVMLLVRTMGGSLDEQIAALLHDISHTAFSHVVDFALRNQEEDYHEQIYQKVIEESEIPDILIKHGYEQKSILSDITKWTLLEQPAPDLCADRIDYTLRDQFHYGDLKKEDIKYYLHSLIVQDGLMCFKTVEAAEKFTELYYKEVIDFFMHPLNVYGYRKLSSLLYIGLKKKILSLEDLLIQDHEVMAILEKSTDSDIRQIIKQIHPDAEVVEDDKNYDFYLKNKPRLLDPMVVETKEMIRASSVSERMKELNELAQEKFRKGTRVRVVSFYPGSETYEA